MQTLQLGWQPAATLSAGLLAGAASARLAWRFSGGRQAGELRRFSGGRRFALAAPYLQEAGLLAAFYALWQLACSVSVLGGEAAFSRARWIARLEQAGGLPSELSVQRLITGHPVLAQSANWYYAAVHFAALGALLLWLFIRHRLRYREVRNVLVLLTASSLLIQLLPVAPPRLLPELGYVDTAARYGQSVYSLSGISLDQLAAMPSVHVGWSLLIAWAVLRVSPGRYRWWVLAHPALTAFVVVATANHFWLDGIAAAVLLALSVGLLRLAGRRSARVEAGLTEAGLIEAGLTEAGLVEAGLVASGARVDDRDAGRRGAGHGRQRRPDLVQADHAGDQLVGSHRAGAD
jgi:hypothetical protein